MKHALTGIDHPVFAVRDMEGSRRAFESLGFVVPPRGRHREWGTGNWCIQFPQSYLELRGILDPSKELHGLDRALATRGEGPMGVAFGTLGAVQSHDSLVAAGLHPRPVKQLTRDFELPSGTIPVSFALCFPAPADAPGLMLTVVCEHLTPELLRRPEWLDHPNGCTGVRGLTGVADHPAALAGAWQKLFEEVRLTEGELRAILPDGTFLSMLSPEVFARRYPGLPVPALQFRPCLAVTTLGSSDLAKTVGWFQRQGIAHAHDVQRVIVAAPETCDATFEFVSR